MLTLYRKNGVLCARCLMQLKRDIHFKNLVFKQDKKGYEDYLEIDAVYKILQNNGNIKIFNGEKFVKYNLGDFSRLVLQNKYNVEEIPEAVKVEPKVEIKPEPKKEEVKEENNVNDELNNENKKKRHKNNQQQVGEDK